MHKIYNLLNAVILNVKGFLHGTISEMKIYKLMATSY